MLVAVMMSNYLAVHGDYPIQAVPAVCPPSVLGPVEEIRQKARTETRWIYACPHGTMDRGQRKKQKGQRKLQRGSGAEPVEGWRVEGNKTKSKHMNKPAIKETLDCC